MALLNQGQAAHVPQDPIATPTPDGTANKKAKKNEAAKRFKERKVEKAKKQYENSLSLRDELAKAGFMDRLSTESKNFILSLCKDPTERVVATGFGGPSVFVTLFGENAKVGDKLTLQQVFNKTYKGKSTMDVWLKRWDEKGIKVSFTPNKEAFLESVYTITTLPAA
jgi:hypothetical protein